MVVLPNLESYIEALQNGNAIEPFDLESEPNAPELKELVKKLFESGRFRLTYRKRLIKELINCLHKSSYIKQTEIKFPVFSKKRAFMSDSGYISISCGFILMCQGARFGKVLLHEIAHLSLLSKEWYPSLLALDREYLDRFKGVKGAITLSPTEYLATRVSILLMQYVKSATENSACGELLAREIKGEEFKLNEALAEIFVKN